MSGILGPERVPMITAEEFEKAIPSFRWNGGHSGRILSQSDAKILEKLWGKFIEKLQKDIDYKTLN